MRKIFKYIVIFIISLIIIILFNHFRYDTLYNFGMSNSIANNETIYKDINLIITPLYPLLMSIGLLIKNTFLIYVIEQSILLTLFYYILERLFKNNNYIIIIIFIMSLACFDFFFPNYNFFIVLLLSILIYMENNDYSDYLIGFILGLIFLTKQNIGIIIYLIAIISPLSLKKSFKRTITFTIPITIFIIYLLINNTMYKFINLAMLGLFDFTNRNKLIDIYIIPVIITFIYNIYCIHKKPKNKTYYYLISTYFFIIPICNRFHAIYFLVANYIILLSQSDITLFSRKYIKYIFCFLIMINLFYYSLINHFAYKNFTIIKDNQLNGFMITSNYLKTINNICKKYNSYHKAKIISDDSMLIDLYNNNKITYLDIPLYGNFGMDGLNNMIENIKKDKGTYYFVINDENYSYQFASELIDYVRNNYKQVDTIENYDIYYIN